MGGSMSSVVISGDTSGAITLAAPAVAGTNTITLPAATGTVMVSGNMPAFSATKSGGGNQSLTANVATKVTFDTEDFDTASCFANSTFTPNVAGYYQISAGLDMFTTGSTMTQSSVMIAKNGAGYRWNYGYATIPQNTDNSPTISALVYCNGTTDYIEIYLFCL